MGNCARALAKTFLCLCMLSPVATLGQDVGDVKDLVELQKYVSDVKEAVDEHKPVPAPPKTNWGVTEISKRLDAMDKYVLGMWVPAPMQFPKSIPMDANFTNALTSLIRQMNDNLAILRQGSTDLSAIGSDLTAFRAAETVVQNALDDMLQKGSGAALDSALGDPVFTAWHELDSDVSHKMALISDHIKSRSKDFSTALAAQQPVYSANIKRWQWAVDNHAQLSAALRSGVAAAARVATGVPTDADIEALRNAGLISTTSVNNGSGGVSPSVNQFLFCSPNPCQ